MSKDVDKLLEIAEEDLEAAKELFRLGKYRVAAFHCQQAVEKYLKAYLLERQGSYPFTHAIAFLVKKCIELDKAFEYLFEIKAQRLTKYYTLTRYLPLIDITKEETKEALEITKKVREFVLKKLNIER